jgi:hypothetical protein
MTVRFSAPLQHNRTAFGIDKLSHDEFSPISTRPIVGMSAILDEVVWQDLSLMEMSTRCHPRGNVALEPLILGWVTLTPCGACS